MRVQIERALGITAIDIYGLSEVMGPGVASECVVHQNGLHVFEDHFLIEIIDPETLDPVPDGDYGQFLATAFPIPLLAPVMIAFLPFKFTIHPFY